MDLDGRGDRDSGLPVVIGIVPGTTWNEFDRSEVGVESSIAAVLDEGVYPARCCTL